MSLDETVLQEEKKHITLGVAGGLSLGVIATAIAGPEIANFVTDVAQHGVNSEWLEGYQHCLNVTQNLGSGADKYFLGRIASLPVVTGLTTATGFVMGVYDKVKAKLGYKPEQKVEGDAWFSRALKVGKVFGDYERKEGVNRDQALYLATRNTYARMISRVPEIADEEKAREALEKIADEKTRFNEFDNERSLLRAKERIIERVTEYALHPDDYTFNDRLSVTGIEKDLAAMAAPVWPVLITYSNTQSVLTTLAVGVASMIAGFVGSVYVDSAINCQLMSNQLKKKKEEDKLLYNNFKMKVASL